MNKRRILVVIFFLPLLLQCQSAPPQAMTSGGNTPAAGILRKARQILTNIKSTRYSHRTVVDEHSGVYVFDCSALVCHILEQAAPQALDVVTVDPGHKRARAKNFYDTFVNAPMGPPRNGWQQIERLADAAPGDLIAWRKDPLPSKGNTGHVVIVMEIPVMDVDGSVRVVVMDAARSGHAGDSRPKKTGGVGSGTMWFRVTADGSPVSFQWSSRKRKPKNTPIAIGRVADIADQARKPS